MDGKLYFVIEFLHIKARQGNTLCAPLFKDVVDGRVIERRFNIGEKLEDVRVERRPFQFVYKRRRMDYEWKPTTNNPSLTT